jgi:PAS domain-containing protein
MIHAASSLLANALFVQRVSDAGLLHVDPAGPAMALRHEIGTDTLMAASLLLALVAMIALGAVVAARRQVRSAARLARYRAKSMSEMLRTVRMAERTSGLGVWQYDPATSAQQLSDGLRQLFGIDHDEPFVQSDAEALLFANDIDLIGKVTARAGETEPYTLHFDMHGFGGMARSISVQACNLVARDGTVNRIVAVVRDITGQPERERELETARDEAMVEARQARELADTDALTAVANRRRVMAELDLMVMVSR